MIWVFSRRDQELRCEVRREADGEAYEFAVTHPDGTEEIERFDDPAVLIERSVNYLDHLRREGWLPIPATVPSQ